MAATLSDGRLAEPHKALALVLGLARAPTSDGRHFALFEELQAAPPLPDPSADKEAADLLATLEKSPEERAAMRDDAAVAALIQESLGDWGADMAGSVDDDDDDDARKDTDAHEEEEEQVQRETLSTQPDREMMATEDGITRVPPSGLHDVEEQEEQVLEQDTEPPPPPQPHSREQPPPVMWASVAEEDPLASARRKASQVFGARAEAASAARSFSSLLMGAPPMLARWTQEGQEGAGSEDITGSRQSLAYFGADASGAVSDKAGGWAGDDTDSNFGGGSTVDLHVGDGDSNKGHHHNRPNLGWGSGNLQNNAAACRVVSEAEVVRAVLHALQGRASPLFDALTTQGDSNQSNGHGLPFRLAHLSASALKAYLSRWAQHAKDLHYLRSLLPNWVASVAPPPQAAPTTKSRLFDHNSSLGGSRRSFNDFPSSSSSSTSSSSSSVGSGGGGTLGAWSSCVAEWVVTADQQLLELERISYQSLSHRGSEGAAAAKAWAYKGAAPSNASSEASFSTSSPFAPPASNARPTASGAQTSNDFKFVCVSTLLQLEGALGPAARRTKDLRRMCHSLLPDIAQCPTDNKNEDDGLSRVRRAVKVVDGVWAALNAAETVHLYKESFFQEGALQRSLPLPPPEAVSSVVWLRQALIQCLNPLLTVLSAWCLEGRYLDPSRETFLSLTTTESTPRTQAASTSTSGAPPARSGAESAVRRSLDSSVSLQAPGVVPVCLKPLAAGLFACGKAVEQMRAAAHKHDAFAAGASLRARRLVPKQSSLQTRAVQQSSSFDTSSSSEVGGWTECGQWVGGMLKAALLQQSRPKTWPRQSSAPSRDQYYSSVPSLGQLFLKSDPTSGGKQTTAPVHHSRAKATDLKKNSNTENMSASSLGLSAGINNLMISETTHLNHDWAVHESAAGFGGCAPLPSVNTAVHPVFCPPKMRSTDNIDEAASSFEEGTDGEEDDDENEIEETGVTEPMSVHSNPHEAPDSQHESSASWLHRVLIRPLSSHCAAAEAAAADTLRRGVASSNDATIGQVNDFGSRTSGGGAGLESALAILRGVYLLGDAEILEGFEAKLFQVSASDSVGSNNSFSGNHGIGIGGGSSTRGVAKVGAYGLLTPRSFDAAALTDLLRSSIADALATRHTSAVQYSQRRRQATSETAAIASSSSSSSSSAVPKYRKGAATLGHQGTDSLPAPLPASFSEDASGLQNISSGEGNSSGALALILDDFSVTLQHAIGSTPPNLSLPAPLHLNNATPILSATPQASFVSNTSFASTSSSSTSSSTNYAPPSSESVKHLNKLVLECKVGWPLNAVVTPKAIEGYNKAFNLLLQVSN